MTRNGAAQGIDKRDLRCLVGKFLCQASSGSRSKRSWARGVHRGDTEAKRIIRPGPYDKQPLDTNTNPLSTRRPSSSPQTRSAAAAACVTVFFPSPSVGRCLCPVLENLACQRQQDMIGPIPALRVSALELFFFNMRMHKFLSALFQSKAHAARRRRLARTLDAMIRTKAQGCFAR
ncbi:hypothetical protein GQ54DRAFT_177265 [Martensiomyces pterosporus]|nr:hypothetical protein GQ54DRAFT_177265 [Martensiomyces pterosporus]